MTDKLCEMLTYRRPNRSKSEKQYIREFIAPHADPDKFGNYIKVIGDNPVTMFSSHTDTVHRHGGRQAISIDSNTETVFVSDPNSNCLGADDTTGNWIMIAMIEAKIPGMYIFHRGEEVGGLGSTYISKHQTEILESIHHAIAFDRMDYADIIDSQSTGKCCSPEFADALASLLSEMGTKWQPTYGLFTDTANYNHLIAECTNISVGYENQHTAKETQSLPFARDLLAACLTLDWASLPVKRDVTDFDDGMYSQYGYGFSNVYESQSMSSGWMDKYARHNPSIARWSAMHAFVKNNPDIVADYLCDQGIGPTYLRNYEWNSQIEETEQLGPEWEWSTEMNGYVNMDTGECKSF